MEDILKFIDSFNKDDYQKELEELNKEVTSKLKIEKLFLEHVFQKHLTSFVPKEFCYLECGVFVGRTLIVSAMGNPDLLCVGVDNWLYGSKNVCLENVKNCGLNNIKVIESDMREFFEKRIDALENKKVKIYLYDADHSFASQVEGLERVLPHLADEAIILVDDTNNENDDPHKGTMKFFQDHRDTIEILKDYKRATHGFSVGTMVLKYTKR